MPICAYNIQSYNSLHHLFWQCQYAYNIQSYKYIHHLFWQCQYVPTISNPTRGYTICWDNANMCLQYLSLQGSTPSVETMPICAYNIQAYKGRHHLLRQCQYVPTISKPTRVDTICWDNANMCLQYPILQGSTPSVLTMPICAYNIQCNKGLYYLF